MSSLRGVKEQSFVTQNQSSFHPQIRVEMNDDETADKTIPNAKGQSNI